MGDEKRGGRKMSRKNGAAAPAVVLAMHGAPPLDFPKNELAEFFMLHARVGHGGAGPNNLKRRYEKLEAKMRRWPRTGDNDPFYAGSVELADELRRESGLDIIPGFNEFCSPSLAEALDRAAHSACRVLVITPMMTRGGEHSAVDIPHAIALARQKYPGNEFIYVWPFPTQDIAAFLSRQVSRFV